MAAQVLPSPIVFPLGAPCPNTPTLILPSRPVPSRPGPLPSSRAGVWWLTSLHLIGKRALHRGDVLLERARIVCWMIASSAGFISRLALFVRLCPISLFSLSCVCFEWTAAGALFWGSFAVIGHYLHRCELCLSARRPFSCADLAFSGQEASLVSYRDCQTWNVELNWRPSYLEMSNVSVHSKGLRYVWLVWSSLSLLVDVITTPSCVQKSSFCIGGYSEVAVCFEWCLQVMITEADFLYFRSFLHNTIPPQNSAIFVN